MERILVIQLAKLGDFIQSTPLLANLRRINPEARIFLLAKEASVLEAAGLSPLVDQVFDSAGKVAEQGFFERVYVLNSHLEAAEAGARLKAGQYFGPRLIENELHFPPAQRFLMSLMMIDRRLGRFNLVDVWNSLVPGAEPLPTSWPEVAASAKQNWPGGFKVGLQLGCRNHLRRWPVEHFVRLGENLLKIGLDFTPVLLGSGDEKALGRKFASLWGSKPVLDLIGSTDLESLAAVVEDLDLLISGDTGVMHLAAAKGKPVLALFFGPAYGPETGPYGAGHIIYQASAPCAPCLESANCRRRQCLEMPRPEIAAAYAGYLLQKAFPGQEARPVLPEGHRLWISARSSFGQDLIPLGQPPLSSEEALALLLTEAGRPLLRPSYRSDSSVLTRILGFYKNVGQCPVNFSHIAGLISAVGFAGRQAEARQFVAEAQKLAMKIGLNIA